MTSPSIIEDHHSKLSKLITTVLVLRNRNQARYIHTILTVRPIVILTSITSRKTVTTGRILPLFLSARLAKIDEMANHMTFFY